MTKTEALHILGLSEGYTPEQLKKAYRKLSKKHHPDIVGTGGTEAFIRIKEAYEWLSSPPRIEVATLTHSSIFTVAKK